MIEGLWVVQYEGLQGNGAGVAVFVNGGILGGDNVYTYEGAYSTQDGWLTARVRIANFLPDIPSVLGITGDFEVEIQAPFDDRNIQGAMAVVGKSGASIAVRLTKKADL
ncbi:MAG: hypothetical protein ACRD2B_08580 [Terriglobia bacterium]